MTATTAPPKTISASDQALLTAYRRVGRTLDDLPYTDDFDSLMAHAKAAGVDRSPHDTFQRLVTLRKAGELPRLGPAVSTPVSSTGSENEFLRLQIIDSIGSLGSRDRLPYSAEFDALKETFCRRTGRILSDHEFWRLIAKVCK